MTVNIENEYLEEITIDYLHIIHDVADAALDYVHCPYAAEVNVLLTDNEQIQQINRENRDIDRATDVLSFPMVDFTAPEDFSIVEQHPEDYFDSDTGELNLGDIVISMDKVYKQAEEYGHSPVRELAFLVAHSMLHLSGYDHMEEEERLIMEQKQEEILIQRGYTRD
jgi:probable rRNA maturation factor